MFKWKKLGRVFNPREIRGRAWLHEFAQAPCTLLFDDFVRVYFSCRPPADANGQYCSYTAFVDLKRTNLFEILRARGEADPSAWGGSGNSTSSASIPCRSSATASEVLAYYGGWTRCESVPFNVAIGCGDERRWWRDVSRSWVAARSCPIPWTSHSC